MYVDNLRFESTSMVLESPGTSVRQDDSGVLTYALAAANGAIAIGQRGADPATWQQTMVAGPVAGPVASVVDVSGRMSVLGRTTAGALTWRRQSGGWQSPAAPSVILAGPPAAAVDAAGKLTFLARTPQNTLVVGWLDSPTSDSWHTATLTDVSSGNVATATGDPAVGLDVGGKLCFFVQTTGNQLLHGWQDSPGATQWHTTIIRQNDTGDPVPVAGRPAIGQTSWGRLVFVARDPAGRLSHGWQTNVGAGPWQWTTLMPVTDTDDDGTHVTATVVGDPAISLDACALLTYFVRTSDGRVLHGWQNAPDSGPWHATLIRDASHTYAQVTGPVAVSQDDIGRLVFTAPAGDGSATVGWQDQPGTGPWHLTRTGTGL